MKQPEINTMILGRTGVGKSSLINYLYGKNERETRAGPPQTKRGDFTHLPVKSPFNPDVTINIFDSWGLEADKAEDWEAIIDKKLDANLSFDEMVYAIVYCSAYLNDRVLQPFEEKRVKKFLDEGYKVTIVLTKADDKGFETKKVVFRETLAKILADYQGKYSVVDICTRPIRKLGESETKLPFGKEELFKELEKDFLINFVNVVYARWTDWKDESLAKLKDFRTRSTNTIEDFKGGFLDTNKERAEQIAKQLRSEMQTLIDGIQEKIQSAVEDFKTWYEHAAGAFCQGNLDLEISTGLVPLDFMLVFVKYSVLGIPLTIFDKLNFKERKDMKKQLLEQLDEAVRAVEAKIRENYRVVENIHEDLKRNQRGKNA
jgi:GTP-binding protein EngB required for normal cell division